MLKGVAHSRWQLARLAWGGLLAPAATPGLTEALARMELQSPRGVRERLEQALLKGAWVRRR